MAMKHINPWEWEYIVIHSSFTKATEFIGLQEMDRLHRSQCKLSVGYHAVIDRDGIIEYGRPMNNAGAHLEEYDRKALGICMIGGQSKKGKGEDNYTDSQYKNLAWLLENMSVSFSNARVVAHGKLDNTTKCPHFSVSAFLLREGLGFLNLRGK
jgi:N-acetylmuramoyl-L-alanine amidase